MEFDTIKAIDFISEMELLVDKNKELLSDLDSRIGDGDLGITMTKAFRAAVAEAKDFGDEKPGRFFIKIGMVIAKAAPSTMGTLIATGFMQGGKAVSERKTLSIKELSDFMNSFTNGIQQRGRAKQGDKTILDVLIPACEILSSFTGESIYEGFLVAEKVAKQALKKTKDMVSQHGKAAIFREATIGIQDPGGTVGYLLIKAFRNTLEIHH